MFHYIRSKHIFIIFLLINLINLSQSSNSTKQHHLLGPPFTPGEWAQRFRCDEEAHNQTRTSSSTGAFLQEAQCQRYDPRRIDYCTKEEDVCWRHDGDWMYKYVDEMNPEFQVLVREKTIDERLANIIYATVTTTELDFPEGQKFNPKDPELKQEFEQLVVGAQVNYTLCEQHLMSILALFDEFQQKLDSARQGEDSNSSKLTHLDERYIRLTRVLDSNGRYTSGSLSGKYLAVGAYEQCLNSQLLLDKEEKEQQEQQHLVGMRVCLAGLSLEPNLSPELRARKRFPHERGAVAMQVLLCLPDSCHSKSLQHHPQLIQRWLDIEFKFPASIYLHQSAKLVSLHCVVDDQSPIGIPTSGKVLLALLVAWLVLIAYATYRTCQISSKASEGHDLSLILQQLDNGRPSEDKQSECGGVPARKEQSFWSCLSLINNWNDFLEIRNVDIRRIPTVTTSITTAHQIDLDVLNPIKVFASIWVTLVHAFLAQHIGSYNLLRDHKLILSDPNMGLVIASPFVVETYFVLSGVLITYLALVRLNKYEKGEETCNDLPTKADNLICQWQMKLLRNFVELLKNCLALIATRYVKLLPLFYVLFWFKKGVYQHLGSGPFWNFGFNKDAGGQCKNESWWSPLSLASVYDPILRKCIPQSYTITSDMIFIILIAPIIFLINKYPKTIVSLIVSLSLWSSAAGLLEFLGANRSMVWNLADFRSYGMFQMFSTPLSYIYTSPEYRLFSILFGVLVGWLVYRYDRDMKTQTKESLKVDRIYWKHWTMKPLSLFAFTYPFVVTLVATFRLELREITTPYHRHLFPYYFMTARTFWALSSAVVFLRLLTDWSDSVLVAWTKARVWRILAKLNYSILLLHLDLLLLDWQIQTNETVLTKYKLLTSLTFTHTACLFIGSLLYVLIENPINKLTKRYIV